MDIIYSDSKSSDIEYHEEKGARVWIEDGIVFIQYTEKYVSEEAVDSGIKIRLKISNGKHYPVLVDTTKSRGSTPDSRKRGQLGNAYDLVTAGAFLIKNPYIKLSFNIFKSIKQFPVPVKAFMTKENAVKYLKQYK